MSRHGPGDGERARTEAARRRVRRARGARLLVAFAVTVLVAAFFRLQVLGRTEYRLRSEDNRLRAIPVPPARGTIYDREGRVLADNVPGYSISLLPGPVDSARVTLQRLAPWLELDEERQAELLSRYRSQPGTPLLIRDDLTVEQVAALEERRPAFRLTLIETHPRRRYPSGLAAAHVLGYVGEISPDELASPEYQGYVQGRVVGKKGIEKQYESRLGGTPGQRFVEVNARGSIVSEFGPRPSIPAVPGEDLHLSLDLNLQLLADSVFPDTMKGAVVALDPNNGEVLLLYSHPSFDPNLFVGGITRRDWAGLRDDPAQPLLNRAVNALYPPGSTWKLVVSTLALRSGVATISTHMSQSCDGTLTWGTRVFRCWKTSGHGSLDLSGAIQQSCNVYFYQLGQRVGLDRLLSGADDMGFNRRTGLDLPSERSGHVPPDREWFDRRYGPRGWTESVVLNLSIGQGETAETVLRMAQFYSALAIGRSPVVPHLVRSEALEGHREGWDLGLSAEQRLQLVHALSRVVNEPGGTAYAHRLADWRMAGKTGTAQNPHGEPHSWFVGFAPVDDPRIVVAAIVENGHPDNTTSLAVPLAARIVRRWLEKEGVPRSPQDVPPVVAAAGR